MDTRSRHLTGLPARIGSGLVGHRAGVDDGHVCQLRRVDDLMPGRAKSPRHRFDLALVQSASDCIEVDFHTVLPTPSPASAVRRRYARRTEQYHGCITTKLSNNTSTPGSAKDPATTPTSPLGKSVSVAEATSVKLI